MRSTSATTTNGNSGYPGPRHDRFRSQITTPLILLSVAGALGAAGALVWVFALRPMSVALVEAVKSIEAQTTSVPTRPRSPNAPEVRRSKG